MHIARVYLPQGHYVIGSRVTGQIEPLTIEYARQAMTWKFQARQIELVDDGTLRSFRAMTLPIEKLSSRDPIHLLEIRSNSQTTTYVQVIYNEDEKPYFLTFETSGFAFEGWIKRK